MSSDPAPAIMPDFAAAGPPARPVYSERLWPSLGIWTATVAFGAAIGLIVAPIDARLAVVVAILGVIGCTLFLVLTTTRLEVTGQHLTAGRATIPITFVSTARALTPEQMKQARGITLDARAYLCLRGWVPAGVTVTLSDPEDPTPYWLISSRHPEAFAAALTAR